jgi:hypothetical protein
MEGNWNQAKEVFSKCQPDKGNAGVGSITLFVGLLDNETLHEFTYRVSFVA